MNRVRPFDVGNVSEELDQPVLCETEQMFENLLLSIGDVPVKEARQMADDQIWILVNQLLFPVQHRARVFLVNLSGKIP